MTGGGGGSFGLQQTISGFSTTDNDCTEVTVLVIGIVVDLGVSMHLVESNEDDRYFLVERVEGVFEGGTTDGGKVASVVCFTADCADEETGTSGPLLFSRLCSSEAVSTELLLSVDF